jgi:hypothetical protein
MAESLSHKFGQIIGELLELAFQPHLERFAQKHKLYLDTKGKRKARSGKKVSWIDDRGNKHDLDFVIERGGAEDKIGAPVAFIESAWRRYTKHSRNKAQEIQSAVLPLARKYNNSAPFLGVVLAGVFTEGALTQLKSLGFGVLYFHYDTVLKAFEKFGIDAAFDEETSEAEFKIKIDSWNKIANQQDVAKELISLNRKNVDEFLKLLSDSVARYIERISILPLHGQEFTIETLLEAVDFLKKYQEDKSELPFARYEVILKYNTGDRIEASFKNKKDAILFLKNYL